MTPDRCGQGSFHVIPAPWAGNKTRDGKIRPNTFIISHPRLQVNGEMAGKLQNLWPAQKQMSAFGKHSILKSSDSRDIL